MPATCQNQASLPARGFSVCTTRFPSHPCQTDKRPKLSKPQTAPHFTYLLLHRRWPYKGSGTKSRVVSIMHGGRRRFCHVCRTVMPLMLSKQCLWINTWRLCTAVVYLQMNKPLLGSRRLLIFSPIASAVNYVIKIREIK